MDRSTSFKARQRLAIASLSSSIMKSVRPKKHIIRLTSVLKSVKAEKDSVVSQLTEAHLGYEYEIACLNFELLAREKELE